MFTEINHDSPDLGIASSVLSPLTGLDNPMEWPSVLRKDIPEPRCEKTTFIRFNEWGCPYTEAALTRRPYRTVATGEPLSGEEEGGTLRKEGYKFKVETGFGSNASECWTRVRCCKL